MIRPAKPTDAAAIAAIWNPIIRDTTLTFNSVEKTQAELEELIKVQPILVHDQGTVTGFATFGPFRSGVGYRFVAEHTIMLAPTAQGRGAGRGLMTALEAEAKAHNIKALWAGVSAENKDGVKFHESMGFTQQARLPDVGHKFGRFIDLVLLQKRL